MAFDWRKIFKKKKWDRYESYKRIKDIDPSELEHLYSYWGKEIICIQHEFDTESWGREYLRQDKFYKLDDIAFEHKGGWVSISSGKIESFRKNISDKSFEDYRVIISCGGRSFNYDRFFDFFKLETVADIRKRKIESILD